MRLAEEEQEKLLAFAQKRRWFENEEEAIRRYLIVSADGLLDANSPDCKRLFTGGWASGT